MKSPKTDKTLYFKPGQVASCGNFWLQRQRQGGVCVVLTNGCFVFIKTGTEEKIELSFNQHSLRFKFSKKVITAQIGMGIISDLNKPGQNNISELFRRHPALFAPSVKSARQFETQFGLLRTNINQRIGILNKQKEVCIYGVKIKEQIVFNIWQKAPQINKEQTTYISWLITNIFNNKLLRVQIDATLLRSFSNSASGYLNTKARNSLNKLLQQQRKENLKAFSGLELDQENVQAWVKQLPGLVGSKDISSLKKASEALAGPLGRL